MDIMQIYRNKLWGVQNLGFKLALVQKKIEVVSKAIAENKIQPVAREIEVHRTFIYI